ncbi:MAG: carboxypeptidase regulatory-like domain-containing protein, partial [bacterium]
MNCLRKALARIFGGIALSIALLFLEGQMQPSLLAYTLTVTSYGGKVEFGSLCPENPPVIIPYAAEMVVVSPSSTWDLRVQAASDLKNTSDNTKIIPISQLKWSPSEVSPNWTSFSTALQTMLSAQPATPAEGKALAYDYRLEINWQDPPGSYAGTLTYTVTAGLIGPSFASPNPFSPNGDGIKDTTEISYYLDANGTITATILEGTTTIRTLLSNVAQLAGVQSITWDGKNDSAVIVADGQYKYLIQNNGSTIASGIITVDTTTSSGTGIVSGKTLDNANSQPLSDTSVGLYEASGKAVGNTTSDPSGNYTFNNVSAGYYYLKAEHTSYYSKTTPLFYVAAGEVVTYNIYLTHNISLFITKEASVKIGEKGDVIGYKINVKNIGVGRVMDIKVEDKLPYNFKYLASTTKINGRKAADPMGNNPLIFSIGTLSEGEETVLTYYVMIGIDASLGEKRNLAYCFGYIEEGKVSAGPVSSFIRVKEGIFRKRGVIIGKVYKDKNGDEIQQAGEEGIPKVKLLMEDGTMVITDSKGRYSIPYVKPGSHVLMIDRTSLPFEILRGYLSHFTVLPEGGMSKVNFGLMPSENPQEREEIKQEERFSLIGLSEGELGYLMAKGNIEALKEGNEGFAPKFYTKSRVALYLKGKIKGEYLLTTILDTNKDEEDRLYEAISPEEYYPIYGDEAGLINSPTTYGRLYVRLDHKDSFLLYGDYPVNFSETRFSSYERTLSGIKADYKGSNSLLSMFRAETKQVACRDDLLGKGVCGPYYLSHYPIVGESESIRIERRDEKTNQVLSLSSQKRNVDYSIDYTQARITFAQPISEREPGGIVYYIVAIYEYVPVGEGDKHYVQGLRARLSLNSLSIGGTYIKEDQSPADFRLYGLDTELAFRLKGSLTLSSEYARTDESINTLGSKDSSAYLTEATFYPFRKLKLKGFYHQVGEDFSNNILSKRETSETNPFSPCFYDLTQLSPDKDVRAYGIKLDYQLSDKFSTSLQKKISSNNVASRPQEITTTQRTSLLDVAYQISKMGSLFINYEEKRSLDDKTRSMINSLNQKTSAGASYSLNKYNLGLKYTLENFTDYTGNSLDTISNLVASKITTRYNHLSPYLGYEFSLKEAKEDKKPLLETHDLNLGSGIYLSPKWSNSISFNYRRSYDYLLKTKSDSMALSLFSEYAYNAKTSGSARYEIRQGKEISNNLTLVFNYKPLNNLKTYAQYTHTDPSNTSIKSIGGEFSLQPTKGLNTQVKCSHNISSIEDKGDVSHSSSSELSFIANIQREFASGLSTYGEYSYEANRGKAGRTTFSLDSKIL